MDSDERSISLAKAKGLSFMHTLYASQSEDIQSDSTRKSGAQTRKQAATWLTPEQVEQIRDACLTDAFPNYLQGRNETIIALLADSGLHVSELVALDWDHLDLNATQPRSTSSAGSRRDEVRRVSRPRGRDSTTVPALPEQCLEDDRGRLPESPVRSRERDVGSANGQKAAEVAKVRPFVADAGRSDPSEVSPCTLRHSIAFRMIRREDKRLEDVMLRLRHSSIQTTDQIYGHLRRR